MGKRRDRGLRYAVATVLALGVLAAVPAVSGAVPSGGYVKLTLTNSTGAPLVLDQNLTSLAHGYFGNSDGMRQAPPHQFFPGTTITVYVIGNFLFQSKGYLAYAGDGGGVRIYFKDYGAESSSENCTSYGADPNSYFCSTFASKHSGLSLSITAILSASPCPGATQTSCPYGQVTPFGKTGAGAGNFIFPWGVAINPSSGVMGVASEGAAAVQAFAATGLPPAFQATYPLPATSNTPVPVGAAANPATGNILVTDTANNRVVVFGPTGGVQIAFGGPGSGQGQFNSPNGIAVNPDPTDQSSYVADTGNNRIQQLQPGGQFVAAWGKSGSGNGEFNLPYGVAVDPVTDDVYVADSGNNRVQVFSNSGTYLRTLSFPSFAGVSLTTPRNLAFDGSGDLYVGDVAGHVFQFNSSGSFVAVWGGNGAIPGTFGQSVGGLAVSPAGVLFAADPVNNRVEGFTPIQQDAVVASSASQVAGRRASVRLHCRHVTGACTGFVRLFHAGRWAGTRTFALAAGDTRSVAVTLNARARAALAAARGHRMTALGVVETRQGSRRLLRTHARVLALRG